MSIRSHNEKVRTTRLRMRLNDRTDISTCCIDNIQRHVHTVVGEVLRELHAGLLGFNLLFVCNRQDEHVLCCFQDWKRVCNGPRG